MDPDNRSVGIEDVRDVDLWGPMYGNKELCKGRAVVGSRARILNEGTKLKERGGLRVCWKGRTRKARLPMGLLVQKKGGVMVG